MRYQRKVYRCTKCDTVHDTAFDYLEHRKKCVPAVDREIDAQKQLGIYMTEAERKEMEDSIRADKESLARFLRGEF